jgi:5-methylcytosine-specific restriction protein A
VCDLNFFDRYGEIGEGFIHVHHKVEISTIGIKYSIDPIKDLIPVCPNCHAMLHKEKPALSINELKKKLVSTR